MDVLWLILTKADEGLEIQASVGKSLALHFVSVRQTSTSHQGVRRCVDTPESARWGHSFPANIVSLHFVWRFTANFVSVRGTETGGAQRRAASAKQLHFSSPHWPLVNNGGFLGKETVKR